MKALFSLSSLMALSKLIPQVKQLYSELNDTPIKVKLHKSSHISFINELDARSGNKSSDTVILANANERTSYYQQFHQDDKPLLLYLPGLDGQGISAKQQFDNLSKSFEFWRMSVDGLDRSLFSELTDTVSDFVMELTSSTTLPVAGDEEEKRKLILVGESFGGLLAPAVVLKLQEQCSKGNFDLKLVLINPATSFDQTSWSTLGPFLSTLKYAPHISEGFPSLYSIFGGMTLAATIPDMKQLQQIIGLITNTTVSTVQEGEEVLRAMGEGFGILEDRLPADTLAHRLKQWLPVGTDIVNRRLHKLKCETLIIGGGDDNLLPTKDEIIRLENTIPHATKVEVKGAGHFVLDERINLTQYIRESPISPFEKPIYDPITDWERPTREFIQETINGQQIQFMRSLVSPVFFSTNEAGERRKGLGAIPSPRENKPLLFVANHQFGGLDLGLVLAQLYEDRDLPVRGLAHPIIFTAANSTNNNNGGGGFGGPPVPNDNGGFMSRSQFETFGAVMVTPRNFYRLMQTGQSALLFPGGVREVFHGKDEAYKLFWPEDTDFVRTAARFNATIVPLSCIGAADSVNILIDAQDMVNLPFGIGERVANSSSSVSSARFNMANDEELFAAPFSLPKPLPDRHYFVFGKPFDTSSLNHKDKHACAKTYRDIQEEMYRGFDSMLHGREKDPFRDTRLRILYERFWGKSAPTFSLNEAL